MAGTLAVDEGYLWPESTAHQVTRSTSTTEVMQVYPARASVPHDLWQQLILSLRADEEGTAGGLQGRIQLHRRYLLDVADLPGIQVRTHATTLYNSLFRFDQDLLVNGHAYGAPAGQSPVMHLRRVPGERMWEHFVRSCVHDGCRP